MRPDVRIVLELARAAAGNRPRPDDWASRLGDVRAWDPILALARAHGLVGFLHRSLASADNTLPQPAVETVSRAWHRQKLRTLAQLAAYRSVLDAMRQRGLPCVVLKGVDLSQRLYPEPGLRPFEDLDLLIRGRDVEPAIRTLRDLGYHLPSHQAPPFMLRRFHFHVALHHPKHGTLIELHWALDDRTCSGGGNV